MSDEFEENLGISRRTLLKRSAVVGGTLVWAAPAVQTLAKPAFASGSPACNSTTCVNVYDKHGNLKGHLICTPAPTFEDCPCVCFGQPGNCPTPTPPGPCTYPQTCGSPQSGAC